jgi:hypothetical protein
MAHLGRFLTINQIFRGSTYERHCSGSLPGRAVSLRPGEPLTDAQMVHGSDLPLASRMRMQASNRTGHGLPESPDRYVASHQPLQGRGQFVRQTLRIRPESGAHALLRFSAQVNHQWKRAA